MLRARCPIRGHAFAAILENMLRQLSLHEPLEITSGGFLTSMHLYEEAVDVVEGRCIHSPSSERLSSARHLVSGAALSLRNDLVGPIALLGCA